MDNLLNSINTSINNININNHGENTQLTASEHEKCVFEICNLFQYKYNNKERFRKFLN